MEKPFGNGATKHSEGTGAKPGVDSNVHILTDEMAHNTDNAFASAVGVTDLRSRTSYDRVGVSPSEGDDTDKECGATYEERC